MTEACCDINREIVYSFKESKIHRIDKCGITTFKYIDSSGQDYGTISVKYSGVVSGFSGYLKFEDDGKVFLLSGDGYFESNDVDASKFEYKDIIATQRPLVGDSACWILNAVNIEQERNERDGSGIIIQYDTK